MSEVNKATVRRLVDAVHNRGQLDLIEELYVPELAAAVRGWITPFHRSFSDIHMEIVDLIAEGDTVVARFTCSATHAGPWLGHPSTGRRFDKVDEVAIYRMRNGCIADEWSLEDTLARMQQLGLRSLLP